MVLQVLANPGQVLGEVNSKAAKRFASPTPESIRSFGLWMVPAARITSLSAAISLPSPPVPGELVRCQGYNANFFASHT